MSRHACSHEQGKFMAWSAGCRHRADQHRVTGILPAFWQEGWTCLRRLLHSPDFRSPGSWNLVCRTRLAFPSKPTQESQRGRRSSYEVDSRLTESFLLFFCFSKWLSECSRISVCSLCYTKAAGSTQFITVFQSNSNSSLSKDKKHSSVPLATSLTFFPFACLFCSPFIFHPHSLPIIFFLFFAISPLLLSRTPLP